MSFKQNSKIPLTKGENLREEKRNVSNFNSVVLLLFTIPYPTSNIRHQRIYKKVKKWKKICIILLIQRI